MKAGRNSDSGNRPSSSKAQQATQDERFRELLEGHEDIVYTLCTRITGDAELGRDAAQETFIRVWRALPDFRGDSSPRTWIWRIAIRCCTELLRRERRGGFHLRVEEFEDRLAATEEARGEELEREDLIRRLLDGLTPAQRSLVLLRFMQGLSYRELVEVTGRSMSSVKVGLHRAVADMRKRAEQLKPAVGTSGELR